jgi:hypothetical protein
LIVSVLLVTTAVLALTYDRCGIHPFSTPNTAGYQELLHGTVTIDNGYYYIQFTVPEHALNIQVIGNYSFSTSSQTKLYILDQKNFDQWHNQSDFNPDFDTKGTSSGDVNATLPSSGVYYVLFETATRRNKLSLLLSWI